MKSMKPIVIGLLAAACAFAQAESAEVAKALAAAPAGQLRDGATVIKWKSDFTYDTLKKGTNRMVCYDLSGFPTHERFPLFVECTSLGNLDRVAQNLKFEAISDKDARAKAFDEAEKNGTRVKPEFGSAWIHMMGPDKEHARMHITVAVPGATSQSMGLPDNGRQGDVWIMNAGTTTAHLMIPGN
jgi:hypothetical protein